jgi:hypothetical protein
MLCKLHRQKGFDFFFSYKIIDGRNLLSTACQPPLDPERHEFSGALEFGQFEPS